MEAEIYGDVPLSVLLSTEEEDLDLSRDLTENLKDKEVLIRGWVHMNRAVSKRMVFLVVRQKMSTVQCVVTAQPDLISDKMRKFMAGLNRESIIDVRGLVSVPSSPIKATSQQF